MSNNNQALDESPTWHAGKQYGNVYISDQAVVQLGDRYFAHRDLFETGNEGQRKAALFNALSFAGDNAKCDHLSLVNVGPDSFSWVADTKLHEWLREGRDPFWIVGKPGSGKSTLMKYLVDSRSTRDQLNMNGGDWKIVHFFFDFRAGSDLANHPLGMVRIFLQQLMKTVEAITKYLEDVDAQRKLSAGTVEDGLEVLAEAVKHADVNVCAFVDGLDEYEGNLWNLCSLFDVLRHKTGMKMCFASRPEPEIRQAFRAWPTIVMQDHNDVSITAYLGRKLAQASAYHYNVERLFSQSLSRALLSKAQGVMLWAKFVIDELLSDCDESTKEEDLFKLLDGLPTELDELYARMLRKIPPDLVSDAALLFYWIVNKLNFSAAVVFRGMIFIQKKRLRTTFLNSSLQEDTIEFRTKAILGNLVDFVLHQNKSSPYLRLIHISLATHFENTRWISHNLPNDLKVLYGEDFQLRLKSDIIRSAPYTELLETETVVHELEEAKSAVQMLPSEKYWRYWSTYDRKVIDDLDYWKTFKNLRYSEDKPEGSNSPLLHWAVSTYMDNLSELSELATAQSFDLIATTMTAGTMPQHLLSCRRCYRSQGFPPWVVRISRLQKNGALHLFFGVMHGLAAFCDQIMSLSAHRPQVMEDLMDILIWNIYNGSWYTFFPTDREHIEAHSAFARLFAKHGYYVEGRHLCAFTIESSENILWKNVKYASLLRPRGSWSRLHSSDCPHAGSQPLLTDWCHERFYFSRWLELFELAGEDVDALLKPDLSPLQAIFELPNSVPSAEHMRSKLLALVMAGTSLMVKSSQGTALSYARSLRRKWKWQLLTGKVKNERTRTDSLARQYIVELDYIIRACRFSTRHKKWPQDIVNEALTQQAKERADITWHEFETILGKDFPDRKGEWETWFEAASMICGPADVN